MKVSINSDSNSEKLTEVLKKIDVCEGDELNLRLYEVFVDVHIYEGSNISFFKFKGLRILKREDLREDRKVIGDDIIYESHLKDLPYGFQSIDVLLKITDGICHIFNT